MILITSEKLGHCILKYVVSNIQHPSDFWQHEKFTFYTQILKCCKRVVFIVINGSSSTEKYRSPTVAQMKAGDINIKTRYKVVP